MAEIVGGFLMPHNPLIFTNPKGAEPDQRDRVMAAYAEIGRRIHALGATTAIAVGTDHYVMFGPGCLPLILIATGELQGPLERLPGLERIPIPNNTPLAEHIAQTGHSSGFDWAVSKSMTIDHSTAIPFHLCLRENGEIPLIPIYQSCGVSPVISLARARQVGAMLADAVAAWSGDERVVVIGSGGISHWVGEASMGRVSEPFDREILDMVVQGDIDGLCGLSDDDITSRGGNGAMEIRNFVCAMSAVKCERGEVIAYEPIPGWITGLGFAELFAPA